MALSDSPNKTAAASLLALSLLAIWGTWGIGGRTGFLGLLKDALEAKIQRLPVVNEPVKQFYTGIGPIDHFIRRLNMFLWPAIDGTWPGLCLVAWELNGQFSAAWMIAGIEGLRQGNRGKLISYTTIFGLISQTFTFAVTVPFYLSLHLLTSPTSLATLQPPTNDIDPSAAFLVNPARLLAWPIAFTLSYLLPTFLVTLPCPSYTSFSTRQTIMAFWDLYPIPFKLLQIVLVRVFTSILPPPINPKSKPQSLPHRKALTLHLLGAIYAFSALVSGLSHIITLTLSLSPLLFPALFTPAARDSLSFGNIFVPVSPWYNEKVEHLGGGLWRFLVWNLAVSEVAPLVWAGVAYWNARLRFAGGEGGKGGEDRVRGNGWGVWGAVVGKIAALTLIGGPGVAIAWLAWEREKIVLGPLRVSKRIE